MQWIDDERAALEQPEASPLTRRQRYRVQILPRANAGETDAEIAEAEGVSPGTVANVRRRFAAGRLDTALHNRSPAGPPRGWMMSRSSASWRHAALAGVNRQGAQNTLREAAGEPGFRRSAANSRLLKKAAAFRVWRADMGR